MSVKVAVRVRPFNERQKFLGCLCCVEMKQNTTVVYENKQKNKKTHYFTFDHSFWSHDQFRVCSDGYMEPITEKYIDQNRIYNIVGKQILQDAWDGYNCCLFAYGQTGAGKSYSMIGYGVNRGIIPMVSEEIFYKIKKNEKRGQKQYEVTLSMLQIYNEKVQDLFVPTSRRPQHGLKIRQNKRLGVYVEGLTKHDVTSYNDIEKRMQEGNKNRSLASTLMNEYSSRAHTIVMLEFIQKQWINKVKMNKKSSFINLVDLAGSQRVSKTGILDNKDRLKEASNINKSLHTLGRVIETLAEQSIGKGKNLQVPYRDSSLTRILESALGGNSKTIMICAISPASDNYEQTLSTLRYADQTKKIKNKPIVNESAVDKIIRELRQENQRLKKMLENAEENPLGHSRGPNYSETEKKQMRSNVRASMREIERQIKKNLKSFAINTDQANEQDEQSLMMTEFIDLEQPSDFFSELSFDIGNKAQVYITNLNEDQLLNFKVRYSCEKDLLITNKNNKKSVKGMEDYAKIVLCGLGIQENHAKIVKKGDKYFIEALSESSADYTLVNGKPIYERRELEHNDRIILGINSIFIFKNNLKKPEGVEPKIDYEFAVTERQSEMENMSIIPPSTLNLFLPTSFLRDNNIKDIYSKPPTQALNATKKLLQSQQNENDVLSKINEIESEFNKLVKQNEDKMKQKQDFYKNRLSQLRKQKEQQKQQRNQLQEQLMIKSIESESLKAKNLQIQAMKKKLSKYYDEKKKRVKARESMLLQSEDNKIEQDIIGEFVDLQDPNEKRRTSEMQVGTNMPNLGKKGQRTSEIYTDLLVEQYQDVDALRKANPEPRERSDSLLLTQEPSSATELNKQAINDQIMNNRMMIMQMEEKLKRMAKFNFRRLYNIKVLSEVDQQMICETCLNKIPKVPEMQGQLSSNKNTYYEPERDAQLQEFHFKSQQEKRISQSKQKQLEELEEQLRLFQAQLVARESRLSRVSFGKQDQMLLNYSIDNGEPERKSESEQQRRRSSFTRNRLSSAEFNLNLTMDSKVELKKQVHQFIQVLGDFPELSIVNETNIKVDHSMPKPELSFKKLEAITIEAEKSQKTEDKIIELCKPSNYESMLLGEDFQEESVEMISKEYGVNTEPVQEDEKQGQSFTAFLNEEIESGKPNNETGAQIIPKIETRDCEMLTEINNQNFNQYVSDLISEKVQEEKNKAERENEEDQIENYLDNQKYFNDFGCNTEEENKIEQIGMNTSQELKKSFGSSPMLRQLSSVNVLDQKIQAGQQIKEANRAKLDIVSGQVDIKPEDMNLFLNESPIKSGLKTDKQGSLFSRDEKMMMSQCLDVRIEPFSVQTKVETIEEEGQNDIVKQDEPQDKKAESRQNSREQKRNSSNRKKSAEHGQDFVDKFNLSVSEIAKHDVSYQQNSVLNFDGLLKEDELNNKIKLLEDKIKELETEAQSKDVKQQAKPEIREDAFEKKNMEDVEEDNKQKKNSKYINLTNEKKKKKKKRHQMTPQQRRQYQIQKQLQAKIIQCNNQNILNDRNIQIRKRKRQAEQLRKVLIKKEKVQLQKQLLVLIPMVRRFNLIAREMKRIIEGKISIEYRNFSHYEMIQILKNYTINKRSSGENIQIKIVIMNVEEGRLYTWPTDVFKNRYQIAEQIFQKYLEYQNDQVSKNRLLQDRTQKSKDPFWDPVDYVSQGIAYLSMEVLLYNLSYQGYISVVYKSVIVAKLYVSLTPVKVKKHSDESYEDQTEELSELEHIQIGNQRNMLEKEMFFTLSIESIKFIKNEERHKPQKPDDGSHFVDLNVVNSNIIKYTLSYELLEDDYKLNNYSTPQIEFDENKQFKRIDYMRRHSFKNISESTLAYISDCPIKFTLNVMKQYNEECLNASLNQDSFESELDTSGFSDSKSLVSQSKKSSFTSNQDAPKEEQKAQKSDFSKKPNNFIFENTEMIAKLEADVKRQQQKLNMNRPKRTEVKSKTSKTERDKDKDKDCRIY